MQDLTTELIQTSDETCSPSFQKSIVLNYRHQQIFIYIIDIKSHFMFCVLSNNFLPIKKHGFDNTYLVFALII